MSDASVFSRRGLLKRPWWFRRGYIARRRRRHWRASLQRRSKTFRIAAFVLPAAILGKAAAATAGISGISPQYLHPTCDFVAARRNTIRKDSTSFHNFFSAIPKFNFDQLPFPDTRITHYYDADPKVAVPFTEAYPGVKVATSVEKMVEEVDAVWMGDASGVGDDHFDLVAPGLARGLPTFCDKPIGGTVDGTRKILDFARKHGAPLMSVQLLAPRMGHGSRAAHARFGRVRRHRACLGPALQPLQARIMDRSMASIRCGRS